MKEKRSKIACGSWDVVSHYKCKVRKVANGELGLTMLTPEGIVQTGCMQLAAARVGHMQLRLAQRQRTSTKTYCGEHGYQQT